MKISTMKTIELDNLNRKFKTVDYGKIPDKPNEVGNI